MAHSTHAATHINAGIAAKSGIKTRDGAKIQSHADCVAFWNTHESSMEKVAARVWKMPLASNVYLVAHWPTERATDGSWSDPEKFSIRLYATDIVFYWPDETFMATLGPADPDFNDGRQIGATPTTVSRINQFTPSHSFYSRYKWRLHGYGAETRVPIDK